MSALTPAILTLLRASLKRPQPPDGTFATGPTAFLVYIAASGPESASWALHAYGRRQALCSEPGPLLALLRREPTDPGFIALALSSSLDPEAALASREDRTAREAALIRTTRDQIEAREAAEDAQWRKRRLTLLDPTAISLDDLD